MGDRGAPGGAWGARDDTSWWPSNTGEIQHQQQINEEIARSTASSTHQLYTYKMAGSFNNDTGDNPNPNYEYRIISTTNNREESNQQPWWFQTGAVESQQISSSPTGQNQASPEPEQSNQQSKTLQQQQQQQQQEQNNSIQQQLQQRHELQQAFEQQQQSIQQNQIQQAIQQNQQQLQQMQQNQHQQNSQQSLQQQTLQQMLQQQQQQQQQVLQQAIQQQTITQAQAQAIVQQAQAALQQQVSQLQQQQSLQDQLQAVQHRDIQAFQRQSANLQDQHPVQQVLINQTANKPRMPRARAFNKPRGRMTAYAFFVQTCREEHKKSNPEDNVVFTLFSKKCAERWSTMNEKEKLRFHEMAELDKQRYDVEMQNYVPPKDMKLPKGRKRNQTKDPNAPKRSLSAFFWFCNDERSKVKAGNPEYTMGDIAKELGRRWAAADPETKSKYEKLSEQDKARYDREMMAYKTGGLALTQQVPIKPELEQAVGRYDVHTEEYK